mgnify:CR=1 FL=1|jgi:hypothetical protein
MSNHNISIVLAGPEEEFFYKEDDIAVPEGNVVGVEIDIGDEVELVLLEDIYWTLDEIIF